MSAPFLLAEHVRASSQHLDQNDRLVEVLDSLAPPGGRS